MSPADAETASAIPHTRMRRAIARTVALSAAVPQFSVEVEVDAAGLRRTRSELVAAGAEVSLSDLLHLAVVRLLPDHPLLNASWTDTQVVLHADVNLTWIVEVEGGMLTPVIQRSQLLDIRELAERRLSLSARATAGTLGVDDTALGTFTVSNLGPLGVRRFNAMVLPPQSAVLAVASAAPDAPLSLTLSVDHRVVDGAVAARFLKDLHARLDDPTWMLTDRPRVQAAR